MKKYIIRRLDRKMKKLCKINNNAKQQKPSIEKSAEICYNENSRTIGENARP